MKYLNELPATVRDARPTFHGLNAADISTAANEIRAGIATVFVKAAMIARLSRYVKTL